jgi:hypothetical protein
LDLSNKSNAKRNYKKVVTQNGGFNTMCAVPSYFFLKELLDTDAVKQQAPMICFG